MSHAFAIFIAVVRRDVTIVWRRLGEIFNPLLFFVIVITLFPLSIGPEIVLLQRIAPAIIWVAALLAAMLSLENIFHADYEDGTLEQLLLGSQPMLVIVAAKVLAHWLISGIPLLLLAPLLGVTLNMPADVIGVMFLTLLIGTPLLSLIGAIGAALTLSQKRGGVLISILVLPLYAPLLVIAAGTIDIAAGEMPVGTHLNLLAALLVLGVSLAPWATAAALSISQE
jgi:heme exporter protein B